MRRDAPTPVGELLVSYSAAEMPTPVIERLHDDVRRDLVAGDRDVLDAIQIMDLLLKISLQKLKAVA